MPRETKPCTLEVESLGTQGWRTRLHRANGDAIRLELRASEERLLVPTVLDGLVAAALPFVMPESSTLIVDGPLSRGALRNFTEFAHAWHSWNPNRFHRLRVQASSLVDGLHYSGPHQAVAAWSGSLRSTHTLIRHACGTTPGSFALRAALRVVGLHPNDAATGLEPARQALATLRLPLSVVEVHSNATPLVDPEIGALPWVASSLHAVAGGQCIGLHARSRRCTATLRYPRPGPDLPDCLAGDAQPIRADGGAASPPRMAHDLRDYRALADLVSDCHRNPRHQAPCGRCPDCHLAYLAFLAGGMPPPLHHKRPGRLSIATLPLHDPVRADNATSILGAWIAPAASLQSVLSLRCTVANKLLQAGETARWLAAVAGLHRPWPR